MATAVGRRYARAAFELASEEDRVEEWRGRLEALLALVSDPKLAAVLTNPTIAASRRMELLSAAESVLDQQATNLARLLIESSHVEDVGAILEEFDRLSDEAAGRVRALVTTAVELSTVDKESLASRLSQKMGEDVRVDSVVDPRILGGLKLQYGDHLIDATVATRLHQLRRRLAEAT